MVVAGTVLGKIMLGAATAAVKASGANTGNGTIAMDPTTPVLANAKSGTYQVRFTSAKAYTVSDPAGGQLGAGANGTAFADRVMFTTTTSSATTSPRPTRMPPQARRTSSTRRPTTCRFYGPCLIPSR